MKQILIFIPILFFILSACSNQKLTSYPVVKAPVVDGHGDDWQDIPVTFNKDLNLAVRSVYLDSMLFLLIQTSNARAAAQIAKRSITIYFDQDHTAGLSYEDDIVGRPQKGYRPQGYFTYFNKNKAIEKELGPTDPVSAAFGEQFGYYGLEIAAPIYGGALLPALVESKGTSIDLTIEIAALPKDMRRKTKQHQSRQQDGMAAGGRRGGGKRAGRMNGGGRNPSEHSNGQLGPDKQSLKLNIVLAKNVE